MTRILRAFAWMRWRILMNSLERTGARDTVERFSVAIEQIGPIIAALLMIPSALLLAGAGGYAGWALATGEPRPLPFEALRYILMLACGMTVVGPFILPAAERSSPVRLLLLPIPRSTLYAAQTASSLSDPWILLTLPVVLSIPLGLAAGGAWLAALFAALAGLILVLVLLGVTALITSVVQLAVRDRRRGELLTLVFILIVPLLGLLPSLLEGNRRHTERREGAPETQMRGRRRGPPDWFAAFERGIFAVVPSERYVGATRSAAADDARGAVPPVVALAASAALLHGFSLFVFGRVLDSPGMIGSRRSGRSAAWGRRVPGLSRGASAVALSQLRLAMRTPRGRSTLLSPLVVFAMFAVMMRRGGGGTDFAFFTLGNGVSLAAFGSAVSLLSILPLAMNQFAIDRAGLTLALLSPLKDRDLLAGKAIGNALIAGGPALFCLAGALVLQPAGRVAAWLCVPLALLATYLIVAPVAAILSAIFPRAVDMNSIGRGSNAHGAAGLLGLLTFVAAAAPCALIIFLAIRVLDRAALAPGLLAAWCAISGVLCWALFIPARRVFNSRRENLALTV